MEIVILILFAVLPLSSIGLCFLHDINYTRKIGINSLLIINGILYLSPLLLAFIGSRSDGNMWDESGSGAALWLYFIIFPVTIVIQILLLIFKLKFSKQKTE
ncbi:MAG: hypothetical protein IPL55_16630 [Saprospiraceae bacterium]|nr:hypothetical protein [Saprospiraceae bacterium]MBL0023700.1 hypothetical protein [Saprospiraceae bacterium]